MLGISESMPDFIENERSQALSLTAVREKTARKTPKIAGGELAVKSKKTTALTN